jgi:hypothetical protein
MSALAIEAVGLAGESPASTRSWGAQANPGDQSSAPHFGFRNEMSSERQNFAQINQILNVSGGNSEPSSRIIVVNIGIGSVFSQPLNEPLLPSAGGNIIAGTDVFVSYSQSSSSVTQWLCTNTTSNAVQMLQATGHHGGGTSLVYETLGTEVATSASSVVQTVSSPMDVLVSELESLRKLPHGWDGEEAAAPIPNAIDEAVSFVRALGDFANRFEPAPDIDGSILLEIDDVGAGSLRFRGDYTIVYAIRGAAPGIVGFDRRTIPRKISEALDAL